MNNDKKSCFHLDFHMVLCASGTSTIQASFMYVRLTLLKITLHLCTK
jgi:hypothetical protein